MTQTITVVPVDARTPDWPRKVAQVLNRLQNTTALAGASAAWGSITGTLSAQADLNTALSGKQAALVSGTNIKTINSTSLLGSGDIAIGGVTSVAQTVPTGFSIAGSPITTTGTLAITFTAGYSLPTDAKQADWDTAFGWGNHASAGYLTTAAAAAAYQPLDTQLTSLAGLSYASNALKVVRVNAGETAFELATVAGGSLADGDYGDVTVGGSGTTLTIDNDAVTYAKMQNVSAASRLLGRGSAGGSGDAEEITAGLGLEISSTTLRRASGTSFPGSPATDDLFYRTDRRIEYFYDGTRWLSVTLYFHSIPAVPTSITATGPAARSPFPACLSTSIYIEKMTLDYILVGTGNWTYALVADADTTIAGSNQNIGSITVATGVSGSHYKTSTNINAVFTPFADITANATENSGTATFFPQGGFSYRLVG